MNNKKPSPLYAVAAPRKMCPICGKASYSAKGIHPQCAVQQADAPRQKILLAAKRESARLVRVRLDGTC